MEDLSVTGRPGLSLEPKDPGRGDEKDIKDLFPSVAQVRNVHGTLLWLSVCDWGFATQHGHRTVDMI